MVEAASTIATSMEAVAKSYLLVQRRLLLNKNVETNNHRLSKSH